MLAVRATLTLALCRRARTSCAPLRVLVRAHSNFSPSDEARSAAPRLPEGRRRRSRVPPVNNKYLAYGKVDFGPLPNILKEGAVPGMVLSVLPAEHNCVDLGAPETFPYGIEEGLVREWRDIAKATLLHGRAQVDLAEGRKDWERKQIDGLVSPVILLSYTSEHGEYMLQRVAEGLAKTIDADFLSVDVRTFLLTTQYLGKEAGRGEPAEQDEFPAASAAVPAARDMLDLDRKTLSHFLKKKLRGYKEGGGGEGGSAGFERPKYPHLVHGVSARPFATALEYLEYCMMVDEDAAERRVIYLHGSQTDLLRNSRFRAELAHMLAAREAVSPQTLFVISDGCKFNPAEPADTKVMMDVDSEASEDLSRTLTNALALAALRNSHLASLPSPHTSADPSFAWIIDGQLRAPRILVVPPTDPCLAAKHRQQIERDVRQMNFDENYSAIYSILTTMSQHDAAYQLLQSALPAPTACPPAFMALLPDLHKRILSSAENVTLCLSLPVAAAAAAQDAISVLSRTVSDFTQNRELQKSALPSLQRQSVAEGGAGGQASGGGGELKTDSLNKHEKRLLPCIVTPAMVRTRYEDVGGLDSVKRVLYELISLRLEQPEYFTKGVLKEAVSGILLFGPPGTGKTMLAKAVAAQSGANFIAVNSSSIFDMYVGEGEKNVKALFSLARKMAPSVVFVDEVDALLDSRANSMGRASRVEIINEFMAEWDGLLSDNQGITVMAATNRPFALDDAVLRRLPRRILVDLPDAAGREQILAVLLRDDSVAATISLRQVAEQTEHYSGSDLKNMCMAAAMRALRRHRATEGGMQIVQGDFEGALADVPASISDRMATLHELRAWDRLYGEGHRGTAKSASIGFNS